MSDIAIKVENLGKLYKLGEVGTGTISHDLNRWFAKMRGKEDPFAKIGEANDRSKKGNSDYVWALDNVNFEIKKGQAVGIIGRNGAGKSTLLKLLSKVTQPSKGEIKINGRIASLLEVGTGFHPEMTGKENIFLNGAIMGMSKREIKMKFDEIVDFAGVERYIDTPVKRYSSGMYVRLAFAVAAYLDPEILIVDEVLAVGDAEFQKKCLGKMKDVSESHGRTVLFVSHNMAAVSALCSKGLLMANGTLYSTGTATEVIHEYLNSETKRTKSLADTKGRPGNGALRFTGLQITDAFERPKTSFLQGESVKFKLEFTINDPTLYYGGIHFSVNIHNANGELIVNHTNKMIGKIFSNDDINSSYGIIFDWKCVPLTPGDYQVSIDCVNVDQFLDNVENAISISIVEGVIYNYEMAPRLGVMAIDADWFLVQ
jgi:lipopolysaccharide transport system ATP-binding protein